MSEPLSTEARRHVRLVKQAWAADAARACSLFGAKDMNALFEYFHDTIGHRMPPKKRREALSNAAQKLASIDGIAATIVKPTKGVCALMMALFPGEGHPFAFVKSDSTAVLLLSHSSRKRASTQQRPTAGLADHLIGRLYERGGLSVPESVEVLARLGFVSAEVALRYKDGDEVYSAITPSLAAVGRVRIGVGEMDRGLVAIPFVDWRTALTLDMLDGKARIMAQDIGLWTVIKPGREVKGARQARPDWIEQHLMRWENE